MHMNLDERCSGRCTPAVPTSPLPWLKQVGRSCLSTTTQDGISRLDLIEESKEFLQLLDATCPEFVWMAPPCTIWPNLQNLTPMTPQRQLALQADRDYEENTHLKMCKRAFQKQQREGRHAGLEQPKNARSWHTPTLEAIEGYDAIFEMPTTSTYRRILTWTWTSSSSCWRIPTADVRLLRRRHQQGLPVQGQRQDLHRRGRPHGRRARDVRHAPGRELQP